MTNGELLFAKLQEAFAAETSKPGYADQPLEMTAEMQFAPDQWARVRVRLEFISIPMLQQLAPNGKPN